MTYEIGGVLKTSLMYWWGVQSTPFIVQHSGLEGWRDCKTEGTSNAVNFGWAGLTPHLSRLTARLPSSESVDKIAALRLPEQKNLASFESA